jgi:hypothetical protein
MNALLGDSPAVKLLPLNASPAGTPAVDKNSAARTRANQVSPLVIKWVEDEWANEIKSVQARAVAITSVLEEILEIRPPSHWGINE